MPPKRNVLLIVIDQLRADCLSGALAAVTPLPHLRALMAEAVSFERHYSVVNPCGPSRASILTGQYAMNHRAIRNGTPLAHDTPNIATESRKAGYLPLLYGYTDSAQDPRSYDPRDPALTSYEEVMPGFHEEVEMRLEKSLPWRADLLSKGYDVPEYPDIFRPGGTELDGPALYRAEDSDTAFLTDQFLRGLLGRPGGWFAHLTYIRPHPPLVAPAPYNRLVVRGDIPAPTTIGNAAFEAAQHPFLPFAQAKTPISAVVEGFPDLEPTDENIATLRAVYFGLAAEVDHHIGRVIAALKAAGIYDDTLLVVTADHGEMLGDHHLWGKSSFYDAAFHTPLIIRDPAAKAGHGRRVDAPTESIDITPTILRWLGRVPPDTMDGRDLTPFLENETPDQWREFTFSELEFGEPIAPTAAQAGLGLSPEQANLAILRGPTHTLVHFNAGLPPMLFDHRSDGEARNVAADGDQQSHLLAMSRAMLDHRMTHAGGRFGRTSITQSGARVAAKHQN
ncbi:sulfatase-like hydrolase/transferase [Pseudorhodobacter sp.]|uniref:sulfatase-like hydrolase/transferase n=1 Tax=Pseudorhodobacter sp. TaxID=1934400 RepID=UPI002647FA22|nr:sulfatase-like hydrolase/transferase [Pseudorhodobacter sp.]MDN5788175.1 sulfatase-like hydrolase/transferase [Pseudorhodobacter sp.]